MKPSSYYFVITIHDTLPVGPKIAIHYQDIVAAPDEKAAMLAGMTHYIELRKIMHGNFGSRLRPCQRDWLERRSEALASIACRRIEHGWSSLSMQCTPWGSSTATASE